MALITLDQYTIIPRPEGDFVLQHREGEFVASGDLDAVINALFANFKDHRQPLLSRLDRPKISINVAIR